MTVEDALRAAVDRAACLRFLVDGAAGCDSVPGREVFSGLADTIGEVEELIRAIRRSLDVDALGVTLKRPR